MKLKTGQPMGPSDAQLAEGELSANFVKQLDVGRQLAERHEKW